MCVCMRSRARVHARINAVKHTMRCQPILKRTSNTGDILPRVRHQAPLLLVSLLSYHDSRLGAALECWEQGKKSCAGLDVHPSSCWRKTWLQRIGLKRGGSAAEASRTLRGLCAGHRLLFSACWNSLACASSMRAQAPSSVIMMPRFWFSNA